MVVKYFQGTTGGQCSEYVQCEGKRETDRDSRTFGILYSRRLRPESHIQALLARYSTLLIADTRSSAQKDERSNRRMNPSKVCRGSSSTIQCELQQAEKRSRP